MKRRILVTLTGMAMSAVLITTGCAGPAGTSAASPATSQTEGSAAANQTSDSAQAGAAESADQTDSADQKAASGNSGDRSSSGKRSKDGSSAETSEELKAVEPSAYAGQTVYGKVTAVSGSQITVKLGTLKERNKKSSSDSDTTDSSTTDPGTAGSNNTDSGATESNSAGSADAAANTAVPSTSAAPANGNGGMTETNGEKAGKGKRSSFKSSGEQMTVTIPESLSDVEIKENYVLSITLDEGGNVTAVEVKSKGRSKPESNKQDGSGETTQL